MRLPLLLKEIQERGIEGRFSPRLGTIVEVSVQSCPIRRAKSDRGPFFLRIDEVDGRKLEKPWKYLPADMPLDREVRGLKVGDEFRCIGYESGRFRGSPSAERAGQPFHLAVPVRGA